MLQFSLRAQDLNPSIVGLVFIPGMDFILLSRPCIWMDRCWISPLYKRHYASFGKVCHAGSDCNLQALQFSSIMDCFSPPGSQYSTFRSMRACLQEGDSQVSCSSIPLKSVSEACDVFGKQVYASTSRRQPRAIAKACIVWGVSYANFQQSFSSLLSLCTVGFWSCNCSFPLSPRNWCGVLKKVRTICFCWVAFTIDGLTGIPQDYPDHVFNQYSFFSLRGK